MNNKTKNQIKKLEKSKYQLRIDEKNLIKCNF